MKCLELRKKPTHCGCHPTKGVTYCAFLGGDKCLVNSHNQAVERAFNAGLLNNPMPDGLMPSNYRLPCEN